MKKQNLQKQLLAAILTGTIAVSACPFAAAAESAVPETTAIETQLSSEETTEPEAEETEISEASTTAETKTETVPAETEPTEIPELETETAADADQLAGDSTEDPVTAFVTRLYTICLARNPDAMGLKNWHDRISSGSISAVEAAMGFLNSKEYQGKQLSDEAYLANLYQVFLNRNGSSAEIQNWIKIYNQGVSRNYLIRGFSSPADRKSVVWERV